MVCHTPAGLLKIETDFRVAGLFGDGPYWWVYHIAEGKLLMGYIHDDNVKYAQPVIPPDLRDKPCGPVHSDVHPRGTAKKGPWARPVLEAT
jgi:hypothetical protein